MSTEADTVVWRVRAVDGAAVDQAFDALVLPHAASPAAGAERHVGLAVPYEGRFADVPHTLVVHARPGVTPLVVEYQIQLASGSMRMGGRSTAPLTAIVRSATGMHVTGLPGLPAESLAPAT